MPIIKEPFGDGFEHRQKGWPVFPTANVRFRHCVAKTRLSAPPNKAANTTTGKIPIPTLLQIRAIRSNTLVRTGPLWRSFD